MDNDLTVMHEGRIVQGTYHVERGMVCVRHGRQERRVHLGPGEEPELAARQLLRELASGPDYPS